MPTPPPGCTETHVAPEAVFRRALRMGQSAMASDPSIMPSVSRWGEATEPESMWSRPIAMGAQLAARDHLVERESGEMPLAVAEPADPRGKALEGDVLLRETDPAGESGIVRKELEHARVRLEDILRIAREGRPAEWPLARREERPDVGGHESRIGK